MCLKKLENLCEVWTQIAKIGVEHFTTGLPVSVAAAVYDLVVYLG